MGSNPTISTDIADGTAPAVPSAISAKMAPNANPVAQRLGSHSQASGAGACSRERAVANHERSELSHHLHHSKRRLVAPFAMAETVPTANAAAERHGFAFAGDRRGSSLTGGSRSESRSEAELSHHLHRYEKRSRRLRFSYRVQMSA